MTSGTIFFDPQCDICMRIKRFLQLIDIQGSFEFLSIHDFSNYDKFDQVNFWDCRKTVHLVDASGQVHRGADVIHYILDQVPVLSMFPGLHRNILTSTVTKMGYELLNEYRKSQLQDCESCRA